jgi:hypothetical protein
MRDVYHILRQKESDLHRLRHEIDSLRIVAPLLADDDIEKELQATPTDNNEPGPEARSTGTDGAMFSTVNSESRFWGLMKRPRHE